MAVLAANGAVAVPSAVEQDLVLINPGTPLDQLTLYVQGGVGGGLVYALYAVVGGVRTRVAQAQAVGSAVATIVAWQVAGENAAGVENLDLGGTAYVVTVATVGGGARGALVATLAGVDEFDTAADSDGATTFVGLAPGGVGTLPTFGGYAQSMDVAIDQADLPPVLVTVEADCGAGSVLAIVKEVEMSGVDGGIAAVFQGLKLPVATRYFVSVENLSSAAITTTLTAVTYSVSITAGGVVALVGNTNGLSNANTDEHFVTSTANANVDVATQAHPKGFIYEGLNGLTADRTVFLNTTATGAIGDQTIVKDEDGSLAAFNIVIDPGAGNTIDGAATYTMTAAQNGIKGSVTLVRISATAWALV